MRDLLQDSEKILIVLPQDYCFDTVAAALGMANIIAKDKQVQIGSSGSIPPEFAAVLDFHNFKLVNRVQEREVILSLNRKEGEVKTVRWREVNGKIQFIITPREGKFDFNDVDLETIGGDIDLVITVGCESLESCGQLYSSNPSFFQNAKILNIDINPKNSNYGIVNKVEDRQSLSDWVLDLADQEGLKLTKEALEVLLKGLLWSNEGFRQDTNLEKAIQKFTSVGGELTETIAQFFNTLTIAQLRYIGKIIANMQTNAAGILSTKISHNELQGVKLDRILFPEINILSRVGNFKVALILTEYEKEKILARIYSHNSEFDIAQRFSDLKPVGNTKKIIFKVEGNLDAVEKDLLDRLAVMLEGKVANQKIQNAQREKQGEKQKPKSHKSKETPLEKATTFPKVQEAPPPISYPTVQTPQGFPPPPQPTTTPQMTPPPPIQPLPPVQNF